MAVHECAYFIHLGIITSTAIRRGNARLGVILDWHADRNFLAREERNYTIERFLTEDLFIEREILLQNVPSRNGSQWGSSINPSKR